MMEQRKRYFSETTRKGYNWDLPTVWRAGRVLETELGAFGATLKRVEAALPTAFNIFN
jgi:hypothetical protein